MLDFEMASGSDARAVLEALGRSLAIVEFEPDGTILSANENFCRALGYDLSEIKGLHHRILVEPSHADGAEYEDFWTKLAQGDSDAREYKCLGKNGREIWFQASYNPIKDKQGVVLKVVAAATDVSGVKLGYAPWKGDLTGLPQDRPIIEFTAAGEVITANDKFLDTFNYNLDEVRGKHHSHFVEPAFAQSPAYQSFWKRLDGGEYVSASFKCVGKGGKEVWIQASYNPVLDGTHQVAKIVTFADDISDFKEIESGLARLAINDLGHPIEKAFSPRLESLRLTFNEAVAHVRSVLRDIGEKADTIDGGIRDVISIASDLSQSNGRQAMKLEEAAAALEHMASTAKKSADDAGHAHRAIVAVDDDIKSSAVVVRKAAESMDVVASSARQMRHIVGVIDEIAFQTNMLALTVSVEAARCGDAGQGFGIVATEVRRLAQRSSEAAKEVKGLILTSATQVQHGVVLIGEIGKSLKRVITHVGEINDGISDIAANAEGQAMGLAGIDIALDQLVEITQKNIAKIERQTALSQGVSRDARDLAQRVAPFRLGPDPATRAPCESPKGPSSAPVAESHAKNRRENRSIRAFEEADIPRVCELFAKTFRPGRPYNAEHLAACIRETYLAPPSYTPLTGSIVHLNAEGIVDGFMGVIPVPYRLGDRSISAGILSAFMADNPKENPAIGVALLRGVLARSFDLLFTDTANQTSLLMCRAIRFTIMPHQSLEWFKLLRPAKTGIRLLGKRSPLAAWVFRPAAAILDGLFLGQLPSPKIKEKRFQGVTDRLIDMAQFVAEAPAFLKTYGLRPTWAPRDLTWMADQARLQTKNGDLEMHAVYDKAGQQAGLYLLYVRKGFVAYLLQLLSKPGREEIVVDSVITRAAEAGAIAIRGATTRETANGLLCRPGVLYHHVMSTVVWTSDQEVAAAVQSGDVFIGGLAGETWAKIVAEDF